MRHTKNLWYLGNVFHMCVAGLLVNFCKNSWRDCANFFLFFSRHENVELSLWMCLGFGYMCHQDLIWNGTANCKNISMRYIFSSQESTEMCVVRIIDYCSIDAGQSWYNNTFCLLPTLEQKLSQFCWNWVQSANCCLSLSKISKKINIFRKESIWFNFKKCSS